MNKFFARILLIAVLATAIGETCLEARWRGHRRHRHRRHWYRHRSPFYGFSYTIGNIALAHSLARRSDAMRQLIDAVNAQNRTIKLMHEDMRRLRDRINDMEDDLKELNTTLGKK